MATCSISLVFSISQGALEFVSPDESFHIMSKDYDLFAHGGMMFWFVSSIVFAVVSIHDKKEVNSVNSNATRPSRQIYAAVTALPWTKLREKLALPTKASFYYYVAILSMLNGAQSVGSGLLLYKVADSGLCVVDVTTFLYYTLLTPFVYYTFLSDFFRYVHYNSIAQLFIFTGNRNSAKRQWRHL